MADLMRMRIPQGWAVLDNKFYDTDPIFDDTGFITNWYEGFIEDVLWIQQAGVVTEEYQILQHHCFSIDISWHPDPELGYRHGAYIAKLFYVCIDSLNEVEVLISQNRFAIRDKLEFWMNDIFENYPVRIEEMRARYPDPEP